MKENTKKVLLIDDDEDIVTMIKAMLQMKGYNVFIKMNLNGIADYTKKISPDLIIMDMLLSGVDGRTICKSFQNNTRIAHIPVLMISAHPNAKEECLNAGADMFLGKPFEMRDLFEAVEKSLLLGRE